MFFCYNFYPDRAKTIIVDGIKKWFDEHMLDGNAIIGISGGKDSTIVAALCVEALGKDRVIGIQMPNGIQKDMDDSDKVFSILGIKKITFNINECFNSIISSISLYQNASQQTINNLPPRLRMSILFAFAQTLNGAVINTTNYSEYYLGWFTFGSDICGNFAPIINFTCTEVKQIGKELSLPDELIYKDPSDGLIGITDEEKFGFTYEFLDNYLRTEDFHYKYDLKEKIDKMHQSSNFKRQQISSVNPFNYLDSKSAITLKKYNL